MTPGLPPAGDFVEPVEADRDEIDHLRQQVEDPYGELVEKGIRRCCSPVGTRQIDHRGESPRGRLSTYLTQRKEFMQQAAETADEVGVSWCYLPVLSNHAIEPVAMEKATDTLGSETSPLRNRWGLVGQVGDDFRIPTEEEVHLD